MTNYPADEKVSVSSSRCSRVGTRLSERLSISQASGGKRFKLKTEEYQLSSYPAHHVFQIASRKANRCSVFKEKWEGVWFLNSIPLDKNKLFLYHNHKEKWYYLWDQRYTSGIKSFPFRDLGYHFFYTYCNKKKKSSSAFSQVLAVRRWCRARTWYVTCSCFSSQRSTIGWLALREERALSLWNWLDQLLGSLGRLL